MGCGCGKSFSNAYATGARRVSTGHVPNQRPASQVTNIQSKSLQSKNAVQTNVPAASGRRKV